MNGTLDDVLELLSDLSTEDFRELTARDVASIRFFVRSDGCSRAPNLFVASCFVHDYYYRTHHDLSGKLISRAQADRNFRRHIQCLSGFNRIPVCEMVWSFNEDIPKITPAILVRLFAIELKPSYLRLGMLSPSSWVRWCGVRLFGASPWKRGVPCHT